MTSEITNDVVDYVEVRFDKYENCWVVEFMNKAGFAIGKSHHLTSKAYAIDAAFYENYGVDIMVSNRDLTDCKIIESNRW